MVTVWKGKSKPYEPMFKGQYVRLGVGERVTGHVLRMKYDRDGNTTYNPDDLKYVYGYVSNEYDGQSDLVPIVVLQDEHKRHDIRRN